MAMIRLLSVGSRGDLQPYLAILLELQRRGHSVQLIGSINFEAIATEHAVPFVPLPAWRLQATSEIETGPEDDAGQARAAGLKAAAGGDVDNSRCGDGRHRSAVAHAAGPVGISPGRGRGVSVDQG